MNDAIRMQLSAYVDGELPGNEAEMLLRRVCQDAELRQEIAEYFAMRRLLRGEAGLAAADRLHRRVAAEIDQRPVEISDGEAKVVRAVRPLAGIAIAASVALLAIFALQQTDTGGEELSADKDVLDEVHDYVPDLGQPTEQHRQFFLNHANASGMKLRSVELRISEELANETDFLDVRDVAREDKIPDADEENEPADGAAVDQVVQP